MYSVVMDDANEAPGGGLGFYGKITCCWENPSQAGEHMKQRNKIWLEDNSGGNTCQFSVDKTSTVCFMKSQQEGGKQLRSLAREKRKAVQKGRPAALAEGSRGLQHAQHTWDDPAELFRWPLCLQPTCRGREPALQALCGCHTSDTVPPQHSGIPWPPGIGVQLGPLLLPRCHVGLCFHPGCSVFHSPKYLWDQIIWNQ